MDAFHILGESLSTDIANDSHHALFISAVFRRTATTSQESTTDSYSCVLIGVSRSFKRRLEEMGAKPCVITDTQEKGVTIGLTSTQGLADRFKGGENIYITGKLCVRLAAQCISEEVLQCITSKSEVISRIPTIRADKTFLHAVPLTPSCVADDLRHHFSDSDKTNSATDSKGASGLHRLHFEGLLTYSSVRDLASTLVELSDRADHALVKSHSNSSTGLDSVSSVALLGEEENSLQGGAKVPSAYHFLQKQSEQLAESAVSVINTTSNSAKESVVQTAQNPMALQIVRANQTVTSSSNKRGRDDSGEPYFKIRFLLCNNRVACFDYFPVIRSDDANSSVQAVTRTNTNNNTTSTNSRTNSISSRSTSPVDTNIAPAVTVTAQDALLELVWERDMDYDSEEEEDEEGDSSGSESDHDHMNEDKDKTNSHKKKRVKYSQELVRVSYHPLLPLCQLVPVTSTDFAAQSGGRVSRLESSGGEVLEAFNADKTGKFVENKTM
eukprot:gene26546-33144_t